MTTPCRFVSPSGIITGMPLAGCDGKATVKEIRCWMSVTVYPADTDIFSRFSGSFRNLFKPVRIVADRTLVPKTSPSLPRHLKLAPPLTVWSVCTELQICTGRPIRSARLSNRKRRLGGCEAKLDFQRPPVPLFETSSLAVPREPDTLSAFPLS